MTMNIQDCLQQSIWQQPLFFQLTSVLALINSLQPSQHQKQPSLLAATLQSMLCFAACLDTICSLFLWRLIQINPCKSLSSPSLSVFPRMSFKIATWGEKKRASHCVFFLRSLAAHQHSHFWPHMTPWVHAQIPSCRVNTQHCYGLSETMEVGRRAEGCGRMPQHKPVKKKSVVT